MSSGERVGRPSGPLFSAAEEVWAKLSSLPPGRRAISLEGMSMYYLQNATTRMMWQDTLPDGMPSPWGDTWSKAIKHRFNTWFAKYRAIGGQVDIVLGDFELGGHAYWYAMRNSAVQIMRDARWPQLREQLNVVGKQWNASFSNISDMPLWPGFGPAPFHDWRAYVWDIVVVDQQVARLLNESVFLPVKNWFPEVIMSNFAHHYHTDASKTTEPATDGWFPWRTTSAVSAAGTGSHVGTHQSTSFYGGSPWQNYSAAGVISKSADHVWQAQGSPFNALAQSAKAARDAALAAPASVGLHPWFAPRDFVCADPGMPPGGTGSWLYGSDLWQEMVFHVALCWFNNIPLVEAGRNAA